MTLKSLQKILIRVCIRENAEFVPEAAQCELCFLI